MKQNDLVQILSTIESVQLRGVQLLRELRLQQPGELFPKITADRTPDIVAATTELMGYALRCQKTAEALTRLSPVVLHSAEITEYL